MVNTLAALTAERDALRTAAERVADEAATWWVQPSRESEGLYAPVTATAALRILRAALAGTTEPRP